MVKTFVSPVRVYKYPFELIAIAYQTRFPYNEKVPIMLRSELLEEHTSEDRTKERKVRRCTLKIDAPYLMRKISGIESALFTTTTELDWVARRFVVTSVNETFSSRCQVIEKCIFSVHSENGEWTCYEQDASIEMISVWGFEQQAEKLAIDRYIARLPKTKEVMELFVQDVMARGLHVPRPYVPPPPPPQLEIAAVATAATATAPTPPTTSEDPRPNTSASCGEESRQLSLSRGSCDTTVAVAVAATASSSASSTSSSAIATAAAAASVAMATSSGSSTKSEERKFDLRRRDSSGIDSDKLEMEYIQRFLGELTPLQQSNLIQLRQKLSATLKDKMPNDAVLLRFLRARDFNIDKARDMLTRHIAWRKQYQVERLLDCYDPSDVVRQFYAGGWHHHDRKGHPVYLIRLGEIDVKGLLKAVGEADLLKQVLAHEEAGLRRCEQVTRSSDKAVSTVTLICDLEGLSLRHLWRPGIRAGDRIIQILLNNYPETMGRLVFVRAPRIFPVLWAIVSQFLDETSREKFVFLGGNDYQAKTGGLTDYIDAQFIPDFLGGPCKCNIPAGGLVPREFYTKTAEEFDHDHESGGCALDTAYQSVMLVKERPCEVVLRVDCDSVLFWDFDITRGKVMFTVLRLNCVGDGADGNDQQEPSPASGHTVASSVTTLSAKSFSETGSYDSRLELSEALPVVGPDLYQDTDSVQGTYTVNRTGIYLLRWEVCPPSATMTSSPVPSTPAVIPSPAASPAIPSLGTPPPSGGGGASSGGPLASASITDRLWPKAHIMYYLEVLEPDRFQGSVSSLESWQSAVSTQDLATDGEEALDVADPVIGGHTAVRLSDMPPSAITMPTRSAAAGHRHHAAPSSSAGAHGASSSSSSLRRHHRHKSPKRSTAAGASAVKATSLAHAASDRHSKPSTQAKPIVRKRQLWTDV